MFLSTKLKQLFSIKIKIISLVKSTSQSLFSTVRISNFVKIKSNINLLILTLILNDFKFFEVWFFQYFPLVTTSESSRYS